MSYDMGSDIIYLLTPPPAPGYMDPNSTAIDYEDFAIQMREETVKALHFELDVAVRELKQKRQQVAEEYKKYETELEDIKHERKRIKYEAMGFVIKCKCFPDADDMTKLYEIQKAAKKKAAAEKRLERREVKRLKILNAPVKIRPTIPRRAAIKASKKLAMMAGK